uniref:DNA-directed RNA polymerase n=1 Tax=viral metagenome TaxID=1070528 RepID=A0A6C0ER26_9ZZZZ
MSDNEYYSEGINSDNESDSESDSSSDIELADTNTKIPVIKSVSNIDTYDDDSDNEIADEAEIDDPKLEYNSEDDYESIDDVGDDDMDEDNLNEETNLQPSYKSVKGGAKSTIPLQFDSDDEDEDEIDENYFQKFDSDITKNYINDFHPECFIHNYEEIASLTKVIRDSNNIIIDPLHRTIPFLTKYERARIIGQRAKQIEAGAKPLVKVPENIIDSYIIADLELQEKRIPFIIRRPLSNGGSEYWNVKDLENICF